MLTRILLTAASVVALSAAANAADMYRAPAAADVPYVGVNWSGFYVGATAGGAWGQSHFTNYAGSNSWDVGGFIGGGELGFNAQLGRNWVVGVEADIQNGPNGTLAQGSKLDNNGWGCLTGECKTDVSWFGTVRGRLGYSLGSTLLFGTGGVAFGDVHSYIANSVDDTKSTNVGWTAGGGVEHKFTQHWSGKAEYLYVDLGETAAGGLGYKSDTTFGVARAGINYHVGGGHESLK